MITLAVRAAEQGNIFISEYAMPEPFIEVASIKKPILSSAKGFLPFRMEKIFTNPKTYAKYKDHFKQFTFKPRRLFQL
jgi:hypothetical protein